MVTRSNTHGATLALALLTGLAGCGGDASEAGGGGFGGTEGDGGAASISGGDDAGTGGDEGGAPPPEEEEEGDFRVPRASGRWVYSASESAGSVAVIDSETLGIEVVGVGRGPTVVAALDQAGHVAVLDQGSQDVAMLTTVSGATSVEIVPVSPGANALEPSPDGAFVVVYHDVDGPEMLGPGSDQELTVIDTQTRAAYEMTVGVHPRDVAFTSDGATAFVVTDDGVNVIPMADLAMLGKPDLIPAIDDPGMDPAKIEIQVAADEGFALARVDGQAQLFATDLQSAEQFSFDLPGIPTDLDLAADGSFAIVTLPALGASRFVELALPLQAGTVPAVYELPGEYVGLAHLSPDATTMLLYTTVDPTAQAPVDPALEGPGATTGTGSSTGSGGDGSGSTGGTGTTGSGGDGSSDDGGPMPPAEDPRQRVSIVRRQGSEWSEPTTLFVDRPVVSVGIAPDGANAMLLHEMDAQAGAGAAWAYTLLDLTKPFPVKKLQSIEAEPGPVLFTPDGARAVLLLRDDATGVQRVDLIDMRSFIVEALGLGSPPEGAGYVDATEKIFVSQEHPTGRITFIGADGAVQTVTGYRLNDAVKD